MEFKDKIKKLRTSRRYTTQYVADYLGIEDRVYCAVEHGGECLTDDDVVKLCALYKISFADFVNGRLKPRIKLFTK